MKMENVIVKKNCFENAEDFMMWERAKLNGVELSIEEASAEYSLFPWSYTSTSKTTVCATTSGAQT